MRILLQKFILPFTDEVITLMNPQAMGGSYARFSKISHTL
jgi:hypothetical protein